MRAEVLGSRKGTVPGSWDRKERDTEQEGGVDLEGTGPADGRTYTKLRSGMPGNICRESYEQFPREGG